MGFGSPCQMRHGRNTNAIERGGIERGLPRSHTNTETETMSKHKIAALILMTSGTVLGLGCSLFGPLRIPISVAGLFNLLPGTGGN